MTEAVKKINGRALGKLCRAYRDDFVKPEYGTFGSWDGHPGCHYVDYNKKKNWHRVTIYDNNNPIKIDPQHVLDYFRNAGYDAKDASYCFDQTCGGVRFYIERELEKQND